MIDIIGIINTLARIKFTYELSCMFDLIIWLPVRPDLAARPSYQRLTQLHMLRADSRSQDEVSHEGLTAQHPTLRGTTRSAPALKGVAADFIALPVFTRFSLTFNRLADGSQYKV